MTASRNINESHGMTGTRIYKIWSGMHSRCKTTSATGYKNYGGKGIKVCQRWESFSCFLEDMGIPSDGQSIERNDSSRDYEPGNCRWATRIEQNRNQSDLVYINYAGKRQCAAAWAEELGVQASTLIARRRNQWPDEKIITTPVRGHKQYQRRAAV